MQAARGMLAKTAAAERRRKMARNSKGVVMRGKNKSGVQGPKTTRRQTEILESGGKHDDSTVSEAELQKIPKKRRVEAMKRGERETDLSGKPGRQSEFPVSRRGMNDESRQHNKS
jgi:hypothetical protein